MNCSIFQVPAIVALIRRLCISFKKLGNTSNAHYLVGIRPHLRDVSGLKLKIPGTCPQFRTNLTIIDNIIPVISRVSAFFVGFLKRLHIAVFLKFQDQPENQIANLASV